ncbi:MAG: ATP-binding cassette domain-containing protein [Planctomycetota bacterium]
MSTAPVVVEKLNHTYGRGGSKRQILFDVSLEIQAGEIVILTGPSGSGKSTLLTLIGALRSAQDGRLEVLGQSLHGAGERVLTSVRRRIGFIFQLHNLLDSLTIERNVQMGLELWPEHDTKARKRLAIEALESVGLRKQIGKYPEQLSGGQKQRAAIARALVTTPEMILADEPTASLDKRSGRDVADLLQRLAKDQGASVVLVTHDNRILDVADRIIHLEDGRLVPLGEAVAAETRQRMTLFSKTKRHEDLDRHIDELDDDEFSALLQSVTAEAEQFLSALEVASSDAFEALLDQALFAFARRIEKILDAERVSLFLLDESKDALWAKVARGESNASLEIRIPAETGIVGHVARTGETANVPDAYADPRFNRSVDDETGFRTRCILAIPLRDAAGQVLGVAQALNRRSADGFDAESERRFGEVAPMLGALLQSWVAMRATTASGGVRS